MQLSNQVQHLETWTISFQVTLKFVLKAVDSIYGGGLRNPAPVENGDLCHYLKGIKHPRWCRISSTVSSIPCFNRPACITVDDPYDDLKEATTGVATADRTSMNEGFLIEPHVGTVVGPQS